MATPRKRFRSAGAAKMDIAYELPFLSHAPMEPQNFTVHVKDGGCEMWGGSQVQTSAVAAAAKTLNTTPDKINFHNYMLGGGFGRRLDTDMVVKSVRIAQKVDGPVKVIWSREEDIQQDMYRPAYRNVMSASLDKDGKIDCLDPSHRRRRGLGAHVGQAAQRRTGSRFAGRRRPRTATAFPISGSNSSRRRPRR